MTKREIAYIIGNEDDPDSEFCIRNMGYPNIDKFRNDVIKNVPLRIDIGAYFDG